jgi:hypothetical protein
VIHLEFGAFIAAGFADFRAQPANLAGKFAAARHHAGCKTANRRTVNVERDTAGHHHRVGLLQAGGRATVAFIRAGIAGIDTGFVVVVRHGRSPWKINHVLHRL